MNRPLGGDLRPLLALDRAARPGTVPPVGARAGSADRETTAVGADPGGHPYRALDDPPMLPVRGGRSSRIARRVMARAFVAKAFYDMPTTRVVGPLGHRRGAAAHLRLGAEAARCRASRSSRAPSPSSSSHTQLPQRVHEALIGEHPPRPAGGPPRVPRLDGHRGFARRPTAKSRRPPAAQAQDGDGRKKGEQRPKVLKRLDRQATMTLPAMLVRPADRRVTWA